jgi:dihydroorotate dehydrogenase
MTNSVAATVDCRGELLFGGQPRGICGDATRQASLDQTAIFSRLIAQRGLDIRLIGVGGASTADHVKTYLDAGAEHVQIATAAMVDPEAALAIRRQWSSSAPPSA